MSSKTRSYLPNAWSPFDGWETPGKVTKVVLHGKTVFENGSVIAAPGSGTILPPTV